MAVDASGALRRDQLAATDAQAHLRAQRVRAEVLTPQPYRALDAYPHHGGRGAPSSPAGPNCDASSPVGEPVRFHRAVRRAAGHGVVRDPLRSGEPDILARYHGTRPRTQTDRVLFRVP